MKRVSIKEPSISTLNFCSKRKQKEEKQFMFLRYRLEDAACHDRDNNLKLSTFAQFVTNSRMNCVIKKNEWEIYETKQCLKWAYCCDHVLDSLTIFLIQCRRLIHFIFRARVWTFRAMSSHLQCTLNGSEFNNEHLSFFLSFRTVELRYSLLF